MAHGKSSLSRSRLNTHTRFGPLVTTEDKEGSNKLRCPSHNGNLGHRALPRTEARRHVLLDVPELPECFPHRRERAERELQQKKKKKKDDIVVSHIGYIYAQILHFFITPNRRTELVWMIVCVYATLATSWDVAPESAHASLAKSHQLTRSS